MTRKQMIELLQTADETIREVMAACSDETSTEEQWEERFAANVLRGSRNCLRGGIEYLRGERTKIDKLPSKTLSDVLS